MAIDTKAKRFSILNLGLPELDLLPDPDGSLVAADRAHFLDLYSGIALGSPIQAPALRLPLGLSHSIGRSGVVVGLPRRGVAS